MASLSSKFKKVVSTAKKAVSSAAKKVSSSLGASVASSQNKTNPAQQKTINQVTNTLNQLKTSQKPNQTLMPPNQSVIPSTSSTQFVTDPKTGKNTYGKVSSNKSSVTPVDAFGNTKKDSVQEVIDKVTGGKSGGQSKLTKSSNGNSTVQDVIDESGITPGDETNMSLMAGARSASSASSPSSSASGSGSKTNNSVSSANGSSGGGASGGSSAFDELNKARQNTEKIIKESEDLYKKDQTAATEAIASDEAVIRDEADAMSKLKNTDLTPTKNALKILDEEIKRNEAQLNTELASIGSTFDAQKSGQADSQSGEAGQLSMGIAGAGGYLGFSGSGAGVMLKLAESHRAELNLLESQREKALTEARSAAAERRFDIVQLKAKEIARIDQETYDRTENYNNRVRKEAEADALKATKLKEQNDIFTAIKGGAKTVEAIFSKLGGTVDVDTISNMLEEVSSGSGSFKFSATQTAGLIGAGMGLDDIAALNEYVSENGYDATIKGMLTPGQRAAADKIFTSGAVGTGGSTGFTAQEKRKLEQAGLLAAPRQDQLDYLYGSKGEDVEYKSPYTSQILEGLTTIDSLPRDLQKDALEDLNNLGFATDNVPEWYQDYEEVSNMQSVHPDELRANWSTFRKTALGEPITDEEDGSAWWKFWD